MNLHSWRDEEGVSETCATTSLSPRPRHAAKRTQDTVPSRQASKHWRQQADAEMPTTPVSPTPSLFIRALPSVYSASLHITADPQPPFGPISPSISGHSVLRIANPKPEKRRRPRRGSAFAAVSASTPHSSRRTGTEIDRDLNFDHYFPPDRWGSESSDAKGKRKARRTSIARPQTHHIDLSPTRPRPSSASFKRSPLNRRVSKVARELSPEASARARPPSSMVATSFDPFTSFIGRLGRISIAVPRRKKASPSRLPISSPIEAGASKFAAVPQIPFLGFSTRGASFADPEVPAQTPRTDLRPQPLALGHTPSSSSASSTMSNRAAVLSLPPFRDHLYPAPTRNPASATLLPDHLQSSRASSSESSHGGRSSAGRASSISSHSSKVASYRKPIPLHLFSPDVPPLVQPATEAVIGDDEERSTTRQFRSSSVSMQRESLDYHPSLRVRRLGAKWQAARSKAAPPSIASVKRATAPALAAVSILGSSTSSSDFGPRQSLSSTRRVATSDYSSHSILNLDLEGASFSDLFLSGPRRTSEEREGAVDRQALSLALGSRRPRKLSGASSSSGGWSAASGRAGSVTTDRKAKRMGSVFIESGLLGPSLSSRSVEHLLDVVDAVPPIPEQFASESPLLPFTPPTTYLSRPLSYYVDPSVAAAAPVPTFIPLSRINAPLPALPSSPSLVPHSVFAERFSVATFPTTPTIDQLESSKDRASHPFLSIDPNARSTFTRSKHVPGLSLSSLTGDATASLLDTFPSPPSTPLTPSPSFSAHAPTWASSVGTSFSFDDDNDDWRGTTDDVLSPPSSYNSNSPHESLYGCGTPGSTTRPNHAGLALRYGEPASTDDELGHGLGFYAGVDGLEMCE